MARCGDAGLKHTYFSRKRRSGAPGVFLRDVGAGLEDPTSRTQREQQQLAVRMRFEYDPLPTAEPQKH